MASRRIPVRIPGALGRRLRRRSLMKGQSESEVVRRALETYLARTGDERWAYDLAKQSGLIGCLRRAPRDLSTSRRHLNGFGNSK
jgi:metal-responsive CopG/Arc/MetJ family transcriptional regulator